MKSKTQVEEAPYQRSSAFWCVVALFFFSVVNKYCAFYGGPTRQFQEFSRLSATALILFLAKMCKVVTIPDLSLDVLRQIWPLTLLNLCRLLFTIGEIVELSTSVLILLKRASVVMALVTELIILEAKASLAVQISTITILLGALISVSADFEFDLLRSLYVLANDSFFVIYLVFVSKILNSTDFGIHGLLYYDSLFSLLPIGILGYYTKDLESFCSYANWGNITFSACFVSSCLFGIFAAYSIISCTFYNSVLTTTMVDCFKDICIAYVSMTIWKDYDSSITNFSAVSISLAGALIYMYVTFKRKYRRIYHF